MKEPRRQHYVFAHIFLRQMVKDEPWKFFAMMASREASKILLDMWNHVGQILKETMNEPGDLPADGLSVTPTRIAGFPSLLITLPKPQGTTEAYFIAMVMKTQHIPKDASEKTPVEYYALEHGFSFSTKSDRTVLTEWKDDAHLNFGDGPPAEIEAFRLAVEKKVGGSKVVGQNEVRL